MLLYAVMYEHGSWDDYQQWVHIVYDDIVAAASHCKDTYFSEVLPLRLNHSTPFANESDAVLFYENLYRAYRDVGATGFDQWFDDDDTFLGVVEKVYHDGSHSLTMGTTRYINDGGANALDLSEALCADCQKSVLHE